MALELKPQDRPDVNKNQAITLIVLFVVTLLIIFLAFRTVGGNIYGPAQQVLRDNQKEVQLKLAEIIPEEIIDLTITDTDGDGLTDYQELEIFHTSPYLWDTDSDGISDKDEIDRKQDPTCPIGDARCNNEILMNEDDAIQREAVSQITDSFVSGQLGLDSFRTILLDQGINQDLLSQLDDETLGLIYQGILANPEDPAAVMEQIMKYVSVSDTASSDTASGAGEQPVISDEVLQVVLSGNMSASELRNFLIELGFSKQLLDDMNDTALVAVYKQTVDRMNNNPDSEITVPIEDIRSFLIASGINSEVINNLSDTQVRSMYYDLVENLSLFQ